MNRHCRAHQREIAASLGLPTAESVLVHLRGCPECRAFAADAQRLSLRARAGAPSAALAQAGSARALAAACATLAVPVVPLTPRWTLPLLLSSAAAAALILALGLAPARSPRGVAQEGAAASAPGAAQSETQALLSDLPLPEGLRAAQALLLGWSPSAEGDLP